MEAVARLGGHIRFLRSPGSRGEHSGGKEGHLHYAVKHHPITSERAFDAPIGADVAMSSGHKRYPRRSSKIEALAPGTRTRWISARTPTGSEKLSNAAMHTTWSNDASANGRCAASPWAKSTAAAAAFARAMATTARLTSTPGTRSPRLATSMARYPGPDASSSTRPPLGTRAARARAASTNRVRSAPVIRAYHAARAPSIAGP